MSDVMLSAGFCLEMSRAHRLTGRSARRATMSSKRQRSSGIKGHCKRAQ